MIMTNFALRLPESIYDDLKSVAKREGVSINQYIMCAVSERVTLSKISNRLKRKTNKLTTDEFVNFLDKNVPDVSPDDHDILRKLT